MMCQFSTEVNMYVTCILIRPLSLVIAQSAIYHDTSSHGFLLIYYTIQPCIISQFIYLQLYIYKYMLDCHYR